MNFRLSLGGFALAVLLVSWATTAQAQSSRLMTFGAVDMWVTPTPGGHGYGAVHYQQDGFLQDSQLNLLYNTDTLYASLDGFTPVSYTHLTLPTICSV